jgi:hypothetical protein
VATFPVMLVVGTEPTVEVQATYTHDSDELPEEGALIRVASEALEDGEHTAQVLSISPGEPIPIRAFRL